MLVELGTFGHTIGTGSYRVTGQLLLLVYYHGTGTSCYGLNVASPFVGRVQKYRVHMGRASPLKRAHHSCVPPSRCQPTAQPPQDADDKDDQTLCHKNHINHLWIDAAPRCGMGWVQGIKVS